MKYILLLLATLSTFISCHDSPSSSAPLPSAQAESAGALTVSPAPSLHGITLQQKGGLLVSKAYLTNLQGNLLQRGNMVRVGDTVLLAIAVQKGWVLKNGTASPGASQTIVTDLDEPVLQSADLFAQMKAVPAAEATHLQLKAIVSKTRPDIQYYTVHFRIWDKNGEGELKGQYRLNMIQ
jgi:hypothetical protein